MALPKRVWTLEVQVEGAWRRVPGQWNSYEEADVAFQNMVISFYKRGLTPTAHKIVTRMS